MREAPPIWSAFTDGVGTNWSWSRTICTVIVLAVLGWASFIVYVDHKIPDLTSAGLFVLAIYGVNRGAEAWETRPASKIMPTSPTTQTVNVDNTNERENQ